MFNVKGLQRRLNFDGDCCIHLPYFPLDKGFTSLIFEDPFLMCFYCLNLFLFLFAFAFDYFYAIFILVFYHLGAVFENLNLLVTWNVV